jgi:hypothetical protein
MFGSSGWLHEVSDEVALGSQWKADQRAEAAGAIGSTRNLQRTKIDIEFNDFVPRA